VGLASVAILPFLTVTLLRDLPSYVRISAPLGGMLVLGKHQASIYDPATR
jgi:hypothetical protein